MEPKRCILLHYKRMSPAERMQRFCALQRMALAQMAPAAKAARERLGCRQRRVHGCD